MIKNAVSSDQMQLIDKEAIVDFGIPSIVLMENAGKAVYEEARKILTSKHKKVLSICGRGNNGGDGLVVSRYLANDAIEVSVYMLCEEKRLKKDPLINFNILRKLDVDIIYINSDTISLSGYNLIIDAIFGTGFKGIPDEFTSAIIDRVNKSKIPVLSVDVPSGLDATTGLCRSSCIKARWTVSFGLPKTGFYIADGPKSTGKLIIKNIGFPTSLLKPR